MMDFFYSFIETIFHSIWQAAILALCFLCFNILFKNIHPLQKRNFLCGLLVLQIIISILTFCMHFSENSIGIFQFSTYNFIHTNWLSRNAVLLFSIYIILLFFRIIALLWKWKSFKTNYSKSLTKPSVEFKVFTELRAYQMGIKRKVALWYSNRIEAPITFGFLKPMIILPFSLLNNLSQSEVEAIILHELSHIKHKDYLLNWALIVVELVYYFNPFIKIIVEHIKLEREKNCDLQVINFKYDKIQYAQTLLRISKNVSRVEYFQIGAITNRNQLLKRVKFFCEDDLKIKKNNTSIYTFSLICLLCIFLTTLFTQTQSLKKTITTFKSNNLTQKKVYKQIVTAEGLILIKTTGTITSSKNKITNVKPLVKIQTSPKDITESSITENNTSNFISLNEPNIKEFIYTVETQKGEITQSYILKQVKGKWIFQPKWMIKEIDTDSVLSQSVDNTAIKIDSVQ